MAAATVSKYVELHDPNVEVVRLVASDGETYTSRKFGVIEGAVVGLNVPSAGFTDESASVTFSGGVATIELVGTDTTDLAITLVLYGTLGK